MRSQLKFNARDEKKTRNQDIKYWNQWNEDKRIFQEKSSSLLSSGAQ